MRLRAKRRELARIAWQARREGNRRPMNPYVIGAWAARYALAVLEWRRLRKREGEG